MGIVVFGSCAFSIESDFKNSLLKVDLVKCGSNDYNVRLYTQKPYSEPVKIIKKTNTSYYMLLPETFHSVGSISPVGDIKNVEVKLFPYAGQDLNNGYTKITIYTTKPVNISPKISTASGSVAPSIDTKKLAQLDSAFNTKQAQIQARERQAQYEANQKQIQQQKALEAQRAAQAEAQRKAQLEAQKRAQIEAQRKAQQLEAQKRAQVEAQKKALIEAQRKAQLEAQRKAQRLEAQKRAQAEAQKRAQEEKLRQQRALQNQIKPQQSVKPAAKPVQKQTPAVQKQAPAVQKTATAPKVTVEQKPQEQAKPTVQQEPQQETQETTQNVVTEDITNNPEINEPVTIPDAIDEQNTKVSFIEILKDKLSPLKPYYYIIIDNPILIIASLVALIGIIMLLLLNKNQKKGQNKDMPEDKTLTDTTEKIDLESLKETDTNINPLIENNAQDEIQSFKDEFKDLAYDVEQSETPVSTMEKEEPYIEPEVLSSVEIAPNRGFMVIDRQGIKALFGYINDDVFLLYQFREYLSDTGIKFRISEKQDDKTFFIVKVDKFKLLVRVTNSSMRLELEM